jgi:hypothetical protein
MLRWSYQVPGKAEGDSEHERRGSVTLAGSCHVRQFSPASFVITSASSRGVTPDKGESPALG